MATNKSICVILFLRMVILASTITFTNAIFGQQSAASTSSTASTSLIVGTTFRPEASIMGESALIDKETGRVYWEGQSSNTLFESIEPLLKNTFFSSIDHIKATVLTSMLLLAGLGYLSTQIRDRLLLLSFKKEIPGLLISITSLYHFLVRLLLFLPQIDKKIVLFIYIVYLFECYNSSTRKYLTNIIIGSDQLESYVEQLRTGTPIVEWTVRCFHYERNIVIRFIQKYFVTTFPSLFTKKVITKVSNGYYNYTDCVDNTIAAVWKRAACVRDTVSSDVSIPSNTTDDSSDTSGSTSTSNKQQHHQHQIGTIGLSSTAPFTKITLSRSIVLSDSITRQDYFNQQTKFVADHSNHDTHAEFSTNIEVNGFQSRIMVIRSTSTSSSSSSKHRAISKFFCSQQCFWFCTVLGLTVPYRILLSSYCDELRLIIVKETSCQKYNNKKQSFISIEESTGRFRTIMQKLLLYGTNNKNKDNNKNTTIVNLQQQEEEQLRSTMLNTTNTSTRITNTSISSNDNTTKTVVVKDGVETSSSSILSNLFSYR